MFAATHERTPSATTRSVAPTGGGVVPVRGPGAVVVVVRVTVVVVVECVTGTVVAVVPVPPECCSGRVVGTTGGVVCPVGTEVVGDATDEVVVGEFVEGACVVGALVEGALVVGALVEGACVGAGPAAVVLVTALGRELEPPSTRTPVSTAHSDTTPRDARRALENCANLSVKIDILLSCRSEDRVHSISRHC